MKNNITKGCKLICIDNRSYSKSHFMEHHPLTLNKIYVRKDISRYGITVKDDNGKHSTFSEWRFKRCFNITNIKIL